MNAIKALALILVLGGGPRRAMAAAGAESFEFLLLDANARAVGMGGAYTALASDANALLYNPAGLALVKAHEATFMHNQFVEGLTQEYAAFAARQGWGASLNYLSFGGIPRTTLSQPGGTGGTFGVSDLALGAGYGRPVLSSLSLGAGVKYIRESIDDVSAAGYALDAGALYGVDAIEGLTLGASLLNLGPDVRFQSAKEKLPLTVRAGAAYAFAAAGLGNTAAFDLSKGRTDKPRIGVGLESVYAKAMALRLGFTTRQDAGVGVTGGVGWIWKAGSVDYAFVPFGDLGIAHRLSLTFRWGQARETAAAGGPVSRSPSPDERFAGADRLIERGSFADAKVELAAAVSSLAPDDRRRTVYYERMGFIALRQDDFARAKDLYAEGLKLAGSLGLRDAPVARMYEGMGSCLMAEGNFSYAAKFFRRAHELAASPRSRRLAEEAESRLKGRKN